jgi:hypothetical protein
MDSQAALAELVRRYLYAYGPATPAHLAQWLAAPNRWAQELFDSLYLEQVIVDGKPGYVVAGDTDFPTDTVSGLWLLPYFEAYTIGCHPRERLFPEPVRQRALGPAREAAGARPQSASSARLRTNTSSRLRQARPDSPRPSVKLASSVTFRNSSLTVPLSWANRSTCATWSNCQYELYAHPKRSRTICKAVVMASSGDVALAMARTISVTASTSVEDSVTWPWSLEIV